MTDTVIDLAATSLSIQDTHDVDANWPRAKYLVGGHRPGARLITAPAAQPVAPVGQVAQRLCHPTLSRE